MKIQTVADEELLRKAHDDTTTSNTRLQYFSTIKPIVL